jgi:hypothetical protein
MYIYRSRDTCPICRAKFGRTCIVRQDERGKTCSTVLKTCSTVLSILTAYSKHTRALTFENLVHGSNLQKQAKPVFPFASAPAFWSRRPYIPMSRRPLREAGGETSVYTGAETKIQIAGAETVRLGHGSCGLTCIWFMCLEHGSWFQVHVPRTWFLVPVARTWFLVPGSCA